MPWTEQLPGGTYRAIWRDAAGAQRSHSGFRQKAAALRFAGEQETLARGGKATYRGRSITWGVWSQRWLELRRVEATTAESDMPRIERWLRPRWDTVPLTRITQEDVQLWVNDLDEEMAPASVAKVYRLLSSSLKAAVRAKVLQVSPCHDIDLPHIPPPDERFLTRAEFATACHYLVEPYRTGMIILAGTGVRFGEMAGLHRHRIDWESMAIDVHETWDGSRIKAYPKSRRKRRVPLAGWVGEAILALGDNGAASCGLPHARGGRCRSGLVVPGPFGAPLNARNVLRRHWKPALQRAGIDPARQHDLRHSTASWLIQAGRSMAEVAEILGHSETAVAARYAHLAGTHMDAVRRVLDTGPAPSAPYLPHDLDLGSESGEAVGQ